MTNLNGRKTFDPKGAIILGQDILSSGAVDPTAPSFTGEIGQVGVWSRILSLSEKFALTTNCSSNLTGEFICQKSSREQSLILPGGEWKTSGRRDQYSAHSEGGGMKNKKQFKRRGMEFLLKPWSGEQSFCINLRGGKSPIKYMRMSSTPPHK